MKKEIKLKMKEELNYPHVRLYKGGYLQSTKTQYMLVAIVTSDLTRSRVLLLVAVGTVRMFR